MLLIKGFIRAEETVIHLGFHLGFLARDQVRVRLVGDLCIVASRLVRVLRLRSLRNVLQQMALDLHARAVLAMV